MTSSTSGYDPYILSLGGRAWDVSYILFLRSLWPDPIYSKILYQMPADILHLHSHSVSSPLTDIAQLVDDSLSHPVGQKTLPTILLYDERGLRLYDNITTGAPEYYLFGAEEQILKDHADDIVKVMHGSTSAPLMDEVILELGAGYALQYSLFGT